MSPEGQAGNANHLRMQQVQRHWASGKVPQIIGFSSDPHNGKNTHQKKTIDDRPDY
jgi:hypothetical protein